MDYYDRLNLALANSLNDSRLHHQLSYIDETAKLAKIIIDNTPVLETKQYLSNIPLNTSIQTVLDFFYTVNPEYSYMFQNILQEKNLYDGREDYSVRFHRILNNNPNKSQVRNDGFVHIDYSETLDDIFTVGHEITHKFIQPKNQGSIIKQFLGETSTVFIEFLLQDYLLENTTYNSDEISTRKNNRLVAVYDDAGALLFENILLNLYKQNNNCITEEILLSYLNSLDKNSKIYQLLSTRGKKYLDEIVNSGSLQFYKRQRYVIGTILASDFHNKIKANPGKISQLYYLIDILGHTDLLADSDLKILGDLDIPIINNGKINISENDIIRLSNCYIQEVTNVLNYQNKNNHTV